MNLYTINTWIVFFLLKRIYFLYKNFYW